jgi:WD40 repeat protein
MPLLPGEPRNEEPVPEQAVKRAAAFDDVLAGFEPSISRSEEHADDPADMAGLMDTILLLRQAAAADGVVPSAYSSPPPKSIGRHAILKLAGEGGFATVWEGFDSVLRRPVAVKVRRPEMLLSESLRRRFVREAEIAARLVHPHIVTIFEVGDDHGREFIAAEFCSGGNLAGWLERHPGPMPPRVAARLCQALCSAAAYAHAAGVVHRDIKPANVLLTPAPPGTEAILYESAGAGLTVKLGDFGLGKLQEPDEAPEQLTQLTRSGTSIGTPAWMAPEQIDRSFGEVGPATDVHAIGLLLHRLLTGRGVRGGGTDAETYRQVLLDEPPTAERLVRTVPRDLAAVADKCLAKHPRDRYPTASALADDLGRWLDGRPTRARPLPPAGRAVRWISRRPVIAGLAAAAVAASLLAAWIGVERARDARVAARQQDAIRQQRAVAELRRGFEALRAGNVAGALAQLDAARGDDPELATSFAGCWLSRRMHGERAILLSPDRKAAANRSRPNDLYSIAIAPRGDMAAVAGADGRVRLLRTITGSMSLNSVAAHDEVNDVGFSADETHLVTAGQDGRVRWWTITETELTLAGEATPGAGPLYAAVFSPDGESIAIGGEDRRVRILRLEAPDEPILLFEFEQPPGTTPEIESLLFVDGGTLAASCGDRIVLLDTTNGQVVRELDRSTITRKTVLGSLTVSADGRRLMACGTDSRAHVWNADTGNIVVSLPKHPAWVQGCCFVPDAKRVATACRDGSIRVFDIETGRLLSRLVGHVGRVWSVVAEPGGMLLSCGADGTVRRWNPDDDIETAAVRERSLDGDEILRLEAGPAAGGDGGGTPFVIADRAGRVSSIEASPDSNRVLPRPERSHAIEIAVDAPRRRLAVSWLDKDHLTLFDLRDTLADVVPENDGTSTGTQRVTLPTEIDPREALLCWTHAGELLVCSRSGRTCLLSSACDGARLLESPLEDPVHELVIDPTGAPRVAAAGKHTVILPLPRTTAPASVVPLLLPIGEESSAVAWSPDGTTLACGTRSGKTLLFNAATGSPQGTLVPHERGIVSVAFSRDGRALVTADNDCVRLSDVATLSTLEEIRLGWPIRVVRLSANDRRLAVGGRMIMKNGTDSARLAVMEFAPP